MAFASLLGTHAAAQDQDPPLTPREQKMADQIKELQERLTALESRLTSSGQTTAATQPAPPPPVGSPAPPPTTGPPPVQGGGTVAATVSSDATSVPGFLQGTAINGMLDGYYGYNFNDPLGRVNLLRANDVLSNNFTLNQADLIIERAADASAGRRLGLRVDLMFGENTETLQGSGQNEPRPQVYRNIFQAYGTYIAPIGSGLTLDFGKFASSLGYEDNYSKDQINYSRSYYFNALPFYHMGLRASYAIDPKISVQYWLVNGANETEDFNGFKSQAFLFTITPTKSISWNVNYYFGQEGHDLLPDYNPGAAVPGSQPGLSTTPVYPTPNGREHIFDTYASWNASKLTLAVEGDYVINRAFNNSAPARIAGAVGYFKYQFTPKFFLGGRIEYLDDRGGLFSGTTQALKDGTISAAFQPAEGFQLRTEFRRDFSNIPFFLTDTVGVLKREQDTATVALIWWFGGKQGTW